MSQQRLCRFQEPDGVRQLRVPLKGGLVYPFGMDRKLKRFTERLENMDRQAAGLGARRIDHPQQLGPKLDILSG